LGVAVWGGRTPPPRAIWGGCQEGFGREIEMSSKKCRRIVSKKICSVMTPQQLERKPSTTGSVGFLAFFLVNLCFLLMGLIVLWIFINPLARAHFSLILPVILAMTLHWRPWHKSSYPTLMYSLFHLKAELLWSCRIIHLISCSSSQN
jgi:hypothetical protein